MKGPDRDFVYATARRLEAAIIAAVPGARDIRQDWENRIARVVVEVDQTRARRAGVTSADVAPLDVGLLLRPPGLGVPRRRRHHPHRRARWTHERGDLDRVRTLSVFGADGAGGAADAGGGRDPGERLRPDRAREPHAHRHRPGALDRDGRRGHGAAHRGRDRGAARHDAAGPLDRVRRHPGPVGRGARGARGQHAALPRLIVVLLVSQFNSFRKPGDHPRHHAARSSSAWRSGCASSARRSGSCRSSACCRLAGIILNNAIVLIDRIDLERAEGSDGDGPIVRAGHPPPPAHRDDHGHHRARPAAADPVARSAVLRHGRGHGGGAARRHRR